jgi:hypothetical protein
MSDATAAPLPLVKLAREKLDRTAWYGFVVGESERLVAIHAVSESYGLDGYRVFRREDVSSMDTEFTRADLVRRALRLKGLAPAMPRSIELHDMRSLMHSAQSAYPLLVIHRELVNPDACEVGRIHMSTNKTYVLRWMTPNAVWESDDRPFLYRDVTLVEFDDAYGNTLAMVAEDRASEAGDKGA